MVMLNWTHRDYQTLQCYTISRYDASLACIELYRIRQGFLYFNYGFQLQAERMQSFSNQVVK